mmetsp:Transcript_4133/g.9661  ORF Transcript_4133/g.9661 Transcript_4133/m.9661 type:complete len:287 (-) Transcript_4133:35-895(-)
MCFAASKRKPDMPQLFNLSTWAEWTETTFADPPLSSDHSPQPQPSMRLGPSQSSPSSGYQGHSKSSLLKVGPRRWESRLCRISMRPVSCCALRHSSQLATTCIWLKTRSPKTSRPTFSQALQQLRRSCSLPSPWISSYFTGWYRVHHWSPSMLRCAGLSCTASKPRAAITGAFLCTSANFQLKAWNTAPGNSRGSMSTSQLSPHTTSSSVCPSSFPFRGDGRSKRYEASSPVQNRFGRFSSQRGMPFKPRHTNLKGMPGVSSASTPGSAHTSFSPDGPTYLRAGAM